MSRSKLLLVLMVLMLLSGCINTGYRRLGSIVSQHDSQPSDEARIVPERV